MNSDLKFTARVAKEFKNLQALNDKENTESGLIVSFELIDDKLNKWIVKLPKDNFKDEKELYNDFSLRNIDYILFEVSLPFEYPFEPPFIRVLEPRFKYMTGHVTIGGSICMELLTNQGWNPVMTLDQIMLIIKQNLIDGKARLDIGNRSQYSLSEAKSAFNRMLNNHPEWK